MDEQDLLRRLTAMDSRLARLETLLGVQSRSIPEHLQNVPLVDRPVEPVIFKEVETPLQIPAAAASLPHAAPPLPPPRPVDQPVVSYSAAPVFTPPKAVQHGALEQAIGLKWAGWIGAVVLVIGAAFGIKYGFDQGWFAFVTPAVRLTMAALAALGLIAAGEWVYRKVNRVSAVGLFGTGVALLFIISYGGYAYFQVYAQSTAFVFMALSALIGTLVARRGGFVSIAVLSMIGANLAPALLRSSHPQMLGFLTYLLLLQITSLALAAWGANPKWWTLRGLSLASTSAWLLVTLDAPPQQTIEVFALLFAALFQAELIFSAVRSKPKAEWAGVTFSILVTAGLTGLLLYLTDDQTITPRLICLLLLAGATAVLSIGCFSLSKKSPAAKSLTIGYALQSLALVVMAVPVALSGIWIAGAWGLLAIVLVVAGYVLDLQIAGIAAVAVWMLAAGDLGFWATGPLQSNRQMGFMLGSVVIPTYAVVGWSLAIVGHLIGAVMKQRRVGDWPRELKITSIIISALGTCLWISVSISALPALGASLLLLVLAWILLSAGRWEEDANLPFQAAIVLGLVTLKYLLVDTLIDRIQPGWTAGDQWPLLTPGMGIALSIVATLLIFHFVPRTENRLLLKARMLLGSTALALIVLLWAGSFEIDRVVERFIPSSTMGIDSMQWKQLLWTSWWMLCACGHLLVMNGLNRRDPLGQVKLLNRLWIFPAVVAGKFIVLDLLVHRLADARGGIVPVLHGPPTITGAIVLGGLILIYHLTGRFREAGLLSQLMRSWIVALGIATIFALGTFAIDQAFINSRLTAGFFFTDSTRAEQVAMSIFWAIFAMGLIISGFVWRAAPMRYVGLSLFAIVLLKVVTIDLSEVSTGYRILSFIGLGVLLLGTSVLYGKVSPKLLPTDLV